MSCNLFSHAIISSSFGASADVSRSKEDKEHLYSLASSDYYEDSELELCGAFIVNDDESVYSELPKPPPVLPQIEVEQETIDYFNKDHSDQY